MKWPKREQWLHMQRPDMFLSISTSDLLTMREYHCLLQLLCPDFPLELTQKAARYVYWTLEANSVLCGLWLLRETWNIYKQSGKNKTIRKETGIWKGVYMRFTQKILTFCISKGKPNDPLWFLWGGLGSTHQIVGQWEEEANTHKHMYTHIHMQNP